MSSPTLIVMGHRVHALERIPRIGKVIGLNRSAAYRQSHVWPLTGPDTSRYVIVPRLLQDLGIPYEVDTEKGAEHADT